MFVQFLQDSNLALKEINCDTKGYQILKDKNKIYNFLIKGLKAPAANILKQEALAIGADFALPKDAILYTREFYDGILMLTIAQSKRLLKKLKMQPFGLKQVALIVEQHLQSFEKKQKIMGIINLTPDSFYEDSRKDTQSAKQEILSCIELGIDYVDIGALSTRPGSDGISKEEELRRLNAIGKWIEKEEIYKQITLSVDTYTPEVAKFCLDCGFSVINDITGFQNEKMLEAVRGYDCACVVMHMQNNPKDMQNNPQYKDLFLEIDSFFADRIKALQSYGIKDIILDVGIGFGKNLEHNCALIRDLGHFLHFGYPLLIGASRKSMVDKIIATPISERLPGTLTIHLEALKNGASIIRCHDVKEHIQALRVWKSLQGE